jgi:hypothetical protein
VAAALRGLVASCYKGAVTHTQPSGVLRALFGEQSLSFD